MGGAVHNPIVHVRQPRGQYRIKLCKRRPDRASPSHGGGEGRVANGLGHGDSLGSRAGTISLQHRPWGIKINLHNRDVQYVCGCQGQHRAPLAGPPLSEVAFFDPIQHVEPYLHKGVIHLARV